MTVARLLESTLSHLSGTLDNAGQSHETFVDPRVKVIGALALTIAAVTARHWEILLVLTGFLTISCLLLRVSWKRLLSGWAGGLFFAAIVAVPAIFTSGWQLALLLVLRSQACLTCWLLLIITTPFNSVLRALRTLHLPAVFVAILSMTFRYIFLLVETAQDMLLSRRSRLVGRMNSTDSRRLLTATAGVLLGKSVHMSDDVYQAMVSRGFRGDIYVLQDFQMKARDWCVLFFISAIAFAVFLFGRS